MWRTIKWILVPKKFLVNARNPGNISRRYEHIRKVKQNNLLKVLNLKNPFSSRNWRGGMKGLISVFVYACVFCVCVFRAPGCECIWLENTVSVELSNYGFFCFCEEHFTGPSDMKLPLLVFHSVQVVKKVKGAKMVPAVCALVLCFSDFCVSAQMHVLFRDCGPAFVSLFTFILIYIFMLSANVASVEISCY